jgi:MFS family permease
MMTDNHSRMSLNKEEDETQNLPLIDKIVSDRGYSCKEQWKIIIFTTLAISLEGMHFNILGMILIPFRNSYNLTDTHIQIISGIMYISVAIGSFLSGLLIKKFSRVNVINNCLLATFILHLLLAFSDSIFTFTIVRILLGLFIGIYIPLMTNLQCEYCPIYRRSFVFNSTWAGYNLGCLFFVSPLLNKITLPPLSLTTTFVPSFEYLTLVTKKLSFSESLLICSYDNFSPKN